MHNNIPPGFESFQVGFSDPASTIDVSFGFQGRPTTIADAYVPSAEKSDSGEITRLRAAMTSLQSHNKDLAQENKALRLQNDELNEDNKWLKDQNEELTLQNELKANALGALGRHVAIARMRPKNVELDSATKARAITLVNQIKQFGADRSSALKEWPLRKMAKQEPAIKKLLDLHEEHQTNPIGVTTMKSGWLAAPLMFSFELRSGHTGLDGKNLPALKQKQETVLRELFGLPANASPQELDEVISLFRKGLEKD